jgi:hypothetical protein
MQDGEGRVARPPRLERGTLCLEGRCSIQLSYGRNGFTLTMWTLPCKHVTTRKAWWLAAARDFSRNSSLHLN